MIRPAEAEDTDRIRACVHAAFAPFVERIGRPPAPMLADYAALVAAGKVHVTAPDLVGLIVLYPRGAALHVENVAVSPEARGKGFGRELMAFAEASARRLRLGAVELYTHQKMTENITYYSALGYREIRRGVEDGFPRVWFRKPVA
ncbi:GNAT family N-acetyltransferase [Emcibacter sp. SYSU 3D8]|uniref:GNAT family N-acetyltransferase n=1 Tax=Emcibacter sp. SYSU 3D8 TaxID=3133969 RepID=UPI0031FEA7F5